VTQLQERLEAEQTVDARIRVLLKVTGLRQDELAELLGNSRTRVNAWARGRSSISPDYAEKLGAAFKVPPDLFLQEEDRSGGYDQLLTRLARLETDVRDVQESVAAFEPLLARIARLLQDDPVRAEGGGR
jgi:transcriptional regulator with XRE-family HTH domain